MKKSAGILAYRFNKGEPEVFLVHPGGPFYKRKDAGFWTIPKGEFEDSAEPLAAAKREFFEETGQKLDGKFVALEPIKQKAGKVGFCWVIEQDIDATQISSNLFDLEWPPKSKKLQSFPEVDKAAWFTIEEAKIKILASQIPLLEQLQKLSE